MIVFLLSRIALYKYVMLCLCYVAPYKSPFQFNELF